MKRIIVLGFLLTVFLLLGMAKPNIQTCCSLNCTTPCFIMNLQPIPEDSGKDQTRGLGNMRIDRMKPGIENRNRPIDAKMVEHIMAVAKEIDPDLCAQLSAMCDKDPEAFEKIIHRQCRRLGSLIRLREEDPDLFEVKVTELKTDAEMYHVAESIRTLDPEDPNTIAKIAELEGLVRVKTAISIRAQMLSIERLERHIDALRVRLEDTSLRFDEIVDERLNQLLQVVRDKDEKPDSRDE